MTDAATKREPGTSEPGTSAARVAGGLAIAVVGAVAVNTVIALIAVAVGASKDFAPLQLPAYATFTVIGVLAGAVGWAAVRRWSRRPGAVLRWLVPTVVVLSLVPDVGLLVSDAQPNTSGIAVAGLMLMHLATSAVAVAVFARALPLPRG